MKADELVKKYEEAKKLKKNWDFKKLIKRTYIPYSEKQNLARSIVTASSYQTINGKQVYMRDTNTMLFIFTMKLIEGYTELEISSENVIADYDLLMESGIMNEILACIPESERNILQDMVDVDRSDLEYNTRSLVAFLETKLDAMEAASGALKKVLDNPEFQKKISQLAK